MEPRVITTRERYEEAIEELDRLMDRNPGKNTPDGDRLELLALLIENYEKDQFPIDNPTPIEAIKFRMDEQGLVGRDLEPFIGSRSKVSEVLSTPSYIERESIVGEWVKNLTITSNQQSGKGHETAKKPE